MLIAKIRKCHLCEFNSQLKCIERLTPWQGAIISTFLRSEIPSIPIHFEHLFSTTMVGIWNQSTKEYKVGSVIKLNILCSSLTFYKPVKHKKVNYKQFWSWNESSLKPKIFVYRYRRFEWNLHLHRLPSNMVQNF